ncbi:MAG: glutamate 5-kinase [Acidobacteriota bacterium]|nr:glutamate 5-kinase [Acidobacteriota bacterium]
MRRVVIKLGSSVVGDERGELRTDVLARACDATRDARERDVEVVLVTSGAIALGVGAMGLGERPTAIAELQGASAVGQGRLFPVYDRLLEARGLIAAQILLSALDLHDRARYLNARQTLSTLLGWGVIPVINENDTTATDEISFGDNDFLAAQVATIVGADLLVLLTDVEGLYTANPREDPAATLIGELSDFSAVEDLAASDATSQWGTGGMRAKLIAADMATAAGIATVVCSGIAEDALAEVIGGGARGTRFPPQPTRHSSFKLWLRYGKPALGSIVVDAGAARALRDGGGSLLPVGIVEVHGSFRAGDAVEIHEQGSGAPALGKGIASYSAEELGRIKGLSSAEVRGLLPDADDEAVHRDRLVLV